MQHPKYPDIPVFTEEEFKRILTEHWFAKEADPTQHLGPWFNQRYNLVNPTLHNMLDDAQARIYIEQNYGALNYYTDQWVIK